jgi:hypothetical protein
MIALPLEIWDNIVSQLASQRLEPLEEVYSTFTPELAACSITCHLLSILARPHLFHTITLYTATRAEALIELISSNEDISAWIRRLTIDASRSWTKRRHYAFSQMQTWLGTDAGRGLVDKLTSLDSLYIYDFEQLSYDEDVPASMRHKGWPNILRLHSITSLVLRDCYILSPNEVVEMLTSAYPNLNTLNIMEFHPETIPDPSSSAAASSARIKHANLRTLRLQNNNPGDHGLNILLGSIECPALTHLTLAPTRNDRDVSTLQYAQPLLSSAPALISLTLLDCEILDSYISPLFLSSNGAIKLLSVQQIDGDLSPTWIPDLLESLLNPSQLQTLELMVESLTGSLEIWQALDEALCDSRFQCEKDGKVLRIVYANEFDNSPFPKTHFSRTQELGWFRIEWPEEQAGSEQDGEDDSDGEDEDQ